MRRLWTSQVGHAMVSITPSFAQDIEIDEVIVEGERHGSNPYADPEAPYKIDRSSSSKLTESLLQFRDFLQPFLRFVGPPLVTTVCRSSRDGYSPFQLLGKVERVILDLLRNNLPNPVVHFDPYLLGGEHFWRHNDDSPSTTHTSDFRHHLNALF